MSDYVELNLLQRVIHLFFQQKLSKKKKKNTEKVEVVMIIS